MLTDLGKLLSGGRLKLNKLALETELLVAEGFIEPHFFAGFSDGHGGEAFYRILSEAASTLNEALALAFVITGNDASVSVIPDGVSVIVNNA